MASYVKAGFGRDLRLLQEELDAIDVGLARLVKDTANAHVGPIIAEVQALLPFDPEHRGWKRGGRGRKRRDPGHIRDSVHADPLSRGALTIVSSHSGGPVHWWSGTIAPKGTEIKIERRPGAGADYVSRKADEVGRDVADALDRLIAEHGL